MPLPVAVIASRKIDVTQITQICIYCFLHDLFYNSS